MEQLGSHWKDIREICTFQNPSKEIKFHSKCTRITGTLHEYQYTIMIISRSIHLRIRGVSDKFVVKIKTHILCSISFFFRKSCHLWYNVEKYCRAGQATADNLAHALCMLDTYGYRHTLRKCNTFCFSTATIVARTRLNVTLYVHCLSCLFHDVVSITAYMSLKGKMNEKLWIDLELILNGFRRQ